jgi:hypothetical protein
MSARSPSVDSSGSLKDAFEDLVATDSDFSSEISAHSAATPESDMRVSSVNVSGNEEANASKHPRFFFSDGSIQFTVNIPANYYAKVLS